MMALATGDAWRYMRKRVAKFPMFWPKASTDSLLELLT